jgi:hypothetical protein
MIWLQPDAPKVRSAVVSGAYGRAPHSDHAWPVEEPEVVDTITEALQVASETLERFTGFAIHPAGTAVETFIATAQVRRLSPSFIPLRGLVSITRQNFVEGIAVVDPATWGITGNSILFTPNLASPWPLEWYYRRMMNCQPPPESIFTVEYQFGSTISAGARRAVLSLAHQFYLETNSCEGCDACQLPSRTTSVMREGIQLDLDTSPLRGRLGLPEIDGWLDAVNPYRASLRSGVFTPDSPPPAVSSVRSARPDWMGTQRSGGAGLNVGATTP